MDPRSLHFIAEACKGELMGGSPETKADRVCTDSRQLRSGDVFIALRGDRYDGHDFLAEAGRKARAVVVERSRDTGSLQGCAVIRVDDTRKALGRLAAGYRGDFTLPVIAVAGSNGKTTTKELIASVLSQKFPTLWSESSFNNDVGVPATLLQTRIEAPGCGHRSGNESSGRIVTSGEDDPAGFRSDYLHWARTSGVFWRLGGRGEGGGLSGGVASRLRQAAGQRR